MITLEHIKNRILAFNTSKICETPIMETKVEAETKVGVETKNEIIEVKTGSDYAIDQFNMRQRHLEYQAAISKNKKTLKNEYEIRYFDTANNFMDAFEKNRYLKKWNRLDDFAKKNRLNEYFTRWLEKHPESSMSLEELTKSLLKQLSDKKTSIKINYDDTNGVILNIERWNI
jgi:hypothetical protein